MQTCFVIQPFDGGKFDKRFREVFKPAIQGAELKEYRVDQDSAVEVPIESIEEGIRTAAICLADITEDNPNVWYELGFAFASGRPVVMVCSEERTGKRFPFDIQHRSIITYKNESPGDYKQLEQNITEKIRALLSRGEVIRQIAQEEQVAPVAGLSQPELVVLASMAGSVTTPSDTCGPNFIKNEVERAGLTKVAFSLGMRRLLKRAFIELIEEHGDFGQSWNEVRVTENGWDWIDGNEQLFRLVRPSKKETIEDSDIPF